MTARYMAAVGLTALWLGPNPCLSQSIVDWYVHGSDPSAPGTAVPYDIAATSEGVAVVGFANNAQIEGDTLVFDGLLSGYMVRSDVSGVKAWGHRGLRTERYKDALLQGYFVATRGDHTYSAEGLARSFDAGAREIGGHMIIAYDHVGGVDWVVPVVDSTDSIAEVNAYIKGLELDGQGRLYYSALFLDTLVVDQQTIVADGMDAIVASIDSDGEYRWASAITGPSNQAPVGVLFDWAGGLDVSPSGRVVVAGLFPVGTVFGAGETTETVLDESGVAIGYFDADGNFLRADLDCIDLSVCGFAVATRIAIAADHSIRTIWRFLWSGGLLEVDVGDTTFTDPGYEGAFVTSHDSTGRLQWATQFRGDGNENLNSIVTDANGNTFVGGEFDALEMTIGPNTTLRKSDLQLDRMDGFIVRLDSLGRVTWTMHMSGPDYQFINAIDVDDVGNVYFASHFGGTAYIGSDAFHSSGLDWLHGKISISTINSVEQVPVAAARLAVFPNPARNHIVVRYPEACGSARLVDTAVFDVLGRTVLTNAAAGPAVADLRLDIRPLPPGLYLAAVTCDAELATAPFVVN